MEICLDIPTWNGHFGRGHLSRSVDVVSHFEQHFHAVAARDIDRASKLAAGHGLQGARQLDLVSEDVVQGRAEVVKRRTLDHHSDGEHVHAQVHRVHGYQKVKGFFYQFPLCSKKIPTLYGDVVRSWRGVDVLKDIDRRVLVPARDARFVSVVNCDVQGRRRDALVRGIAVHE